MKRLSKGAKEEEKYIVHKRVYVVAESRETAAQENEREFVFLRLSTFMEVPRRIACRANKWLKYDVKR